MSWYGVSERRSRRNSRLAGAGMIAMALAALFAAAGAKTKPPETYNYGDEPDWVVIKPLAEAAIRAPFFDPESARFEWPNGFKQATWYVLLQGHRHGYITCGWVNARNRFGGYVGRTAFAVIADGERIDYTEVDTSPGGSVGAQCASLGSLPPAPADDGVGSGGVATGGLGMALTIVPDGAYVATVAAGGTAEQSGIKPGMVVAQLNGVQLKGMDQPMVDRLIDATAGPDTLTMIGGATFKVVKAPGPPPPRKKEPLPELPDLLDLEDQK